MERSRLLVGTQHFDERTERECGGIDQDVDLAAAGAFGAEGGEIGRRRKCAMTQFKQIFSNNKRKVLYEITGKVAF